MSILVREWLMMLRLLDQTTHEDRVEIDRELERRTGVYCDDVIRRRLITEQEFREIVAKILKHKKKRDKVVPSIV